MPRGIPFDLAVPVLGQRTDLEPPRVPDGYFWRSQNVVNRFGEIVLRPGLEVVNVVGPGGRIMGGVFFRTPAGVSRVVLGTKTKWFRQNATSWTDITGASPLTGTDDDPVRFTTFPSGGITYAVGVNNVNGIKLWDGTAGAYVDVTGGTPPTTARDLCVASNRVVAGNVIDGGVRVGSRVRCSDFNDPNTWDPLNTFDLPDAGGDIVGVRQLGRTAFVVYKDGSLWIASGQAGVFPFRFDFIEEWPGPCSPSAIVTAGPSHYYLGGDARIYKVSSVGAEPVSDAVDRDLLTSGPNVFRTINKKRAWGFYKADDFTVWFFYPGPTSSEPDHAVSFNVRTNACALHSFAQKMTAGWPGDSIATLTWQDLLPYTWANVANTYPTWESFGGSLVSTCFVGNASGQLFRFRYDIDDVGTPIAWSAEYPMKAWAGPNQLLTVDAAELSFEQVTAGDPITVEAGISQADADGPDVPTPPYVLLGQHDPSIKERQVLTLAGDVAGNKGQFVSVKLSGRTSKRMHYRGGTFYVFPEAAA